VEWAAQELFAATLATTFAKLHASVWARIGERSDLLVGAPHDNDRMIANVVDVIVA